MSASNMPGFMSNDASDFVRCLRGQQGSRMQKYATPGHESIEAVIVHKNQVHSRLKSCCFQDRSCDILHIAFDFRITNDGHASLRRYGQCRANNGCGDREGDGYAADG